MTAKELEEISAKDNPKDVTPKNVKITIYFKEIIWPTVKKNYLISN